MWFRNGTGVDHVQAGREGFSGPGDNSSRRGQGPIEIERASLVFSSTAALKKVPPRFCVSAEFVQGRYYCTDLRVRLERPGGAASPRNTYSRSIVYRRMLRSIRQSQTLLTEP